FGRFENLAFGASCSRRRKSRITPGLSPRASAAFPPCLHRYCGPSFPPGEIGRIPSASSPAGTLSIEETSMRMFHRVAGDALAVVALALLAPSARGTTLVRRGLEELTTENARIMVARVLETRSYWN